MGAFDCPSYNMHRDNATRLLTVSALLEPKLNRAAIPITFLPRLWASLYSLSSENSII